MDENIIPVNGTLDEIAYYLVQVWGYSEAEAKKTAVFLWLEQEGNRSSMGDHIHQNPIPKLSLEDFSTSEHHARGMVANSRIAINLDKTKADVFKAIPWEIAEGILIESWPIRILTILLHISHIASDSIHVVPEDQLCVCMRAWKYVKGKTHTPFSAENLLPEREFSKDLKSPYVCNLMSEDGRAHMGHASWECKIHLSGNYCNLSVEQIDKLLEKLVKQEILDNVSEKMYVFL